MPSMICSSYELYLSVSMTSWRDFRIGPGLLLEAELRRLWFGCGCLLYGRGSGYRRSGRGARQTGSGPGN